MFGYLHKAFGDFQAPIIFRDGCSDPYPEVLQGQLDPICHRGGKSVGIHLIIGFQFGAMHKGIPW
jgi:hypothetical protein